MGNRVTFYYSRPYKHWCWKGNLMNNFNGNPNTQNYLLNIKIKEQIMNNTKQNTNKTTAMQQKY